MSQHDNKRPSLGSVKWPPWILGRWSSHFEELGALSRRWRGEGLRSALVPTMGALHAGHLALVHEAREHAGRVVATIFVNPKQFAAEEDLGRYPRDEPGDVHKLGEAGVDVVFAPSAEHVYPAGFATGIVLGGPAAAGLEDKFRPGFFPGVATVVAKLLIGAACDFAMFGEKDYQQLMVVKAMVRDLLIPTTVIGVPTLREADGLAMSSRNAYLSAEERAVAPALHHSLEEAARDIRLGVAFAHRRVAGETGPHPPRFQGRLLERPQRRHARRPEVRRRARCGFWPPPLSATPGSSTISPSTDRTRSGPSPSPPRGGRERSSVGGACESVVRRARERIAHSERTSPLTRQVVGRRRARCCAVLAARRGACRGRENSVTTVRAPPVRCAASPAVSSGPMFG